MKVGDDPLCISRETADQYVNDWKNGSYSIVPSGSESASDLALDAFVFRIQDFKDFVARVDADTLNREITGVVCRIGIKRNPVSDNPPMVPCLVFEAVVNFNPDDPNIQPGDSQPDLIYPAEPNNGRTTARYDFSYPCPPTCPK